MRHALGLDGQTQAPRLEEQPSQSGPGQDRLSLHRPPRRFVKDGEVPVTVVRRTHPSDAAASIVQPAANQLEAARQTIRSQAAATERAERALNEAQVTIRDLWTKLAHERLAKDEVYQLVRRLEGERDAALTSVQDMRVELAGKGSDGRSSNRNCAGPANRGRRPRTGNSCQSARAVDRASIPCQVRSGRARSSQPMSWATPA